jgi:hypothetical protein
VLRRQGRDFTITTTPTDAHHVGQSVDKTGKAARVVVNDIGVYHPK